MSNVGYRSHVRWDDLGVEIDLFVVIYSLVEKLFPVGQLDLLRYLPTLETCHYLLASSYPHKFKVVHTQQVGVPLLSKVK